MRVAVIVVSMSLLLPRLYVAEIGIQPFEALLPMPPVLADPVGDVAQRLGLEPARPPLGVPTLLDETRTLEHLEVLRDAGQAHIERGGQLGDCRLSLSES